MPVITRPSVLDTQVLPAVAFVNATASGNTQVVAAQPGLRIAVLGAIIVSAAAVGLHFRSGTTTPITATWPLAANGGYSFPPGSWPIAVTNPSEALNVNLSAAVTGGVGVHVIYAVIP
jgi:hypothetical protein